MFELDKLDKGPFTKKRSILLTDAMMEELDMWAEIAGWSFAKTVRYLLVLAMKTFEPDGARDYEKG